MENDDIQIIVNSNGKRIEVSFPWDSDAWEWANAFKVIMTWATFHPNTVDKVINTEEDQKCTCYQDKNCDCSNCDEDDYEDVAYDPEDCEID